MAKLNRVIAIVGTVWLVVCQGLVSAALLRDGYLDLCCGQPSLIGAWLGGTGIVGLLGGWLFIVSPCALVFWVLALVAHRRKDDGAFKGVSAVAIHLTTFLVGALLAGFMLLQTFAAPMLIVLIAVLPTAVALWIVWSRMKGSPSLPELKTED